MVLLPWNCLKEIWDRKEKRKTERGGTQGPICIFPFMKKHPFNTGLNLSSPSIFLFHAERIISSTARAPCLSSLSPSRHPISVAQGLFFTSLLFPPSHFLPLYNGAQIPLLACRVRFLSLFYSCLLLCVCVWMCVCSLLCASISLSSCFFSSRSSAASFASLDPTQFFSSLLSVPRHCCNSRYLSAFTLF